MKTIQLKDILAISGKGGLYKFIAQARNGIVVESLESKKRHVAPASARVNSLEDISVFTHEEEVPLADIFYLIHEKTEGKKTLSHKAAEEELTGRFKELVPDYDEDRVYTSDIRKVFHWYNELQEHGLLEVIDKKEEEEAAGDEKPEKPEKPSAEKKKGSEDPAVKKGARNTKA
jgi:ribosomal protein L24